MIKEKEDASAKVSQFFLWITGIVLPSFALLLLFYEIILFLYHIYSAPQYTIEPTHILHALILSATSVAFVGMHRAVHKLIPRGKMQDLGKKDFVFFFILIANAILLAGLIIVYAKYLPKQIHLDDERQSAPCFYEKLHANKH